MTFARRVPRGGIQIEGGTQTYLTGRGMAFCSKCGQSLRDGAKFCSSCGALVTSPTPAAPIVPTIPAPNVQKRAGRLAVIEFLFSLALTIAVDVTTSDKTLNYVGIVIAFAIGAVYIILNLRRWEKKHEIGSGDARVRG